MCYGRNVLDQQRQAMIKLMIEIVSLGVSVRVRVMVRVSGLAG